ncbi:MAG: (d)CMP kinase [Chloroflexota bacterium]|nr:MAG: (d)CMP kinase [Chloroflexota bacterium]
MSAEIIAIDGPAGSGKSTLGKKLADCLGYLYFDTGVMYRAVTLAALYKGVEISDEAGVSRLAYEVQIDVQPPSIQDGRGYDVLLDGEDVTWAIRGAEVDANVSVVSAYEGVRQALTAAQRRIGLRGRVVMVGRDIGTVVLPEADLKVYLDASIEERAERRYQELCERGVPADRLAILRGLEARDQIDSTREFAPLKIADDAVVLNSDGMDAQEVFERVRELVTCR